MAKNIAMAATLDERTYREEAEWRYEMGLLAGELVVVETALEREAGTRRIHLAQPERKRKAPLVLEFVANETEKDQRRNRNLSLSPRKGKQGRNQEGSQPRQILEENPEVRRTQVMVQA